MPEFFPLGKKKCGQECSANLGVWGYDCCKDDAKKCCGSITIGGYVAAGAIGVLLILIILMLLCRRRG
ncbi:hypothetical protein Y032_0066g3769 [Ancylostoma ceylanicum]|uniref:Uncharacterized protein n=1 Tax=Ancylostoma ceylanicum TaxID=53326 RepID=A0A016U036_9BILA|nr:hypothetical protein Y032_0066g3769 [Ancylostoma ceylanicum]